MDLCFASVSNLPIGLYATRMSQRDIAEQIKALYGVEISPELVSKISEKILPQIAEWQSRPLEETYPFVFMDAVHYKVRDDERIVTEAAYVVLGVNLEGYKEILGIWIGENETSKSWLGVLNHLKSRGVKAVYLFCADGLNGFREAIGAAFPKAQIQRCIIHQIRSSSRLWAGKISRPSSPDSRPSMARNRKPCTILTPNDTNARARTSRAPKAPDEARG